MKKKNILLYTLLCLLTTGCEGKKDIFAPDVLFIVNGGNHLLAGNRYNNELIMFGPDLLAVQNKVKLSSPVTGLTEGDNNTLWVICDGQKGKLYELNSYDLSIRSEMETGYSPSSIIQNKQTQTLWITQRLNNELWEINPATKEIISKIPVGREPVGIVTFAADSLLLVANNLPEASSLTFPIASQVDVVDALNKKVIKRIALPNGSTDVKAITTDANHEYAYIAHILARYQLPTNQVDRGWMCTNALTIINLKTREPETTVLLDTPQKGAANPWEVAVSPDNKYIVVAIAGTHELAHIDRNALHQRIEQVKAGVKVTPSTRDLAYIPNDAGFLYGIREFIPTDGKGPRTVAIDKNNIFTANYFTGEILKMNLKGNKNGKRTTAGIYAETPVGKGDMYFHDATIGFQGWQSCNSCHPNDARADGLNWDLMNDGMGNPKNTKTLVLSHQTPPCMITGIRKDANVAVRSGIKHILFAKDNEEAAQAMDTYLQSLSPLQSPYLVDGKLSESAKRGKKHFDNNCATCHSGKYYTDQQQYLVDWTHGVNKDLKMDVPALNEVWRTAPYLYDGRSYTMQEMLKVHGPREQLSEKDLNDLAEYVLSL